MNPRFNPDCETFDEIIGYYAKRALQLKREGIEINSICELEFGALVLFTEPNNIEFYVSLYITPKYRGKNIFKTFLKESVEKYIPEELQGLKLKVITSDDCGLAEFLFKNNIEHRFVTLNHGTYSDIVNYYGNRKAKRSGVDYMNHIDEAYIIANTLELEKPLQVLYAYNIHPILQNDEDLVNFMENQLPFRENKYNFDSIELIHAMEYRSVANEYLSKRKIESIEEIRLSPLKVVNDMLIIDKIQNRKDFDLYHKGTHERSDILVEYFDNWFKRLGITDEMYNKCLQAMNLKATIYTIYMKLN